MLFNRIMATRQLCVEYWISLYMYLYIFKTLLQPSIHWRLYIYEFRIDWLIRWSQRIWSTAASQLKYSVYDMSSDMSSFKFNICLYYFILIYSFNRLVGSVDVVCCVDQKTDSLSRGICKISENILHIDVHFQNVSVCLDTCLKDSKCSSYEFSLKTAECLFGYANIADCYSYLEGNNLEHRRGNLIDFNHSAFACYRF